MDGHRGVLEPSGEERVDESVRVQHQAVAVADAGARRELQAVGLDPVTHRHGVPELRPDTREAREELVEFLLRGDVRFRVNTRVELQADAHQVVGRARVVVERNHPEPAAREHVVQGPLVPAPALPLDLEDVVERLDPEHVRVEAARVRLEATRLFAELELDRERRAGAAAVDHVPAGEPFALGGGHRDAVFVGVVFGHVRLLANRAAVFDGGLQQVGVDVLPVIVALRTPRQLGNDALRELFRVVLLAGFMEHEAEVALDARARRDVTLRRVERRDVVELRNAVAIGDDAVHERRLGDRRFADREPRVRRLLDDQHAKLLLGQDGSHLGAGHARAEDDHVEVMAIAPVRGALLSHGAHSPCEIEHMGARIGRQGPSSAARRRDRAARVSVSRSPSMLGAYPPLPIVGPLRPASYARSANFR